jgi:hypothetical protein
MKEQVALYQEKGVTEIAIHEKCVEFKT